MKGKHYSPPPKTLCCSKGGDGGTGDPLFRKAIIISRVRVTAGPPEALEFRHQLGCMPDQFVPHLGRILWKYRQKGSRKKKLPKRRSKFLTNFCPKWGIFIWPTDPFPRNKITHSTNLTKFARFWCDSLAPWDEKVRKWVSVPPLPPPWNKKYHHTMLTVA